MSKTALIAIGGNSLIRAGEKGTIQEQLANAHATARSIVQMVKRGWNVVITHGNGPQVGAALLRSERAAGEVYTHPLDVCGATTQARSVICFSVPWSTSSADRVENPVTTVLTQVRVDPTIPPFSTRQNRLALLLQRNRRGKETYPWLGYCRRCLPGLSPRCCFPRTYRSVRRGHYPQDLGMGIIVIALGGGGIPVIEKDNHLVEGSEAVIDKDRASALLALG